MVIIIPARYESSRFPGKPLAMIKGKTMIERVYEQCIKTGIKTYIATDSQKIADHCIDMGCIYTGDCPTGTDRVAEAYKLISEEHQTIINVQGDEPLINPQDIIDIAEYHSNNKAPIVCGMTELTEGFNDTSIIKVVVDKNNKLLYMSRAGIPTTKDGDFILAHRQICIYAFTPDALLAFHDNKKSPLESIEDIEILRALENGWEVQMLKVSGESIAVNNLSDIKLVEARI